MEIYYKRANIGTIKLYLVLPKIRRVIPLPVPQIGANRAEGDWQSLAIQVAVLDAAPIGSVLVEHWATEDHSDIRVLEKQDVGWQWTRAAYNFVARRGVDLGVLDFDGQIRPTK